MKKMKLKKVYPYLDGFYVVRVWAADTIDSEFKIVYEGYLNEIPKKYKKYYLIKRKDNDDSEAITVVDWNWNESKIKGVGYRITLVKKY